MRALVVDDEAAMRMLIVRELVKLGFSCDRANDGDEAEDRVSKADYDAVITDLKMPNKHGHALAVYLLTLKHRPVIVIHTGVIEPKLAKDLLARGVDDILFKPCDFRLLAVKVKALAERRRSQNEEMRRTTEVIANELTPSSPQGKKSIDAPISLANIETRLTGLSCILPISTAGLDVYNMTSTDVWETPQIAATIQQDASLAAEVLRLANSTFYNPSRQRIVQLERAVVQIGQKRIGEVALAANALTSLTSGLVPWMNIGLTWKRSMAAGLAVEMLIDEGRYQQVEQGLLLSAIMHSLGRVVLGTLYPAQYKTMVENCSLNNDRLLEQERGMFPINHTEVMALLLASWGVPPEIHLPLKHLLFDPASCNKLADSTRTKVELLAFAIFLGNLAVGEWETWDTVDIPSDTLLRKLGANLVAEFVGRIKNDVEELANLRTDGSDVCRTVPIPTSLREMAYCDLSGVPFDFLKETISSMGIKLCDLSPDDLNDYEEKALVNCVGTAPQRLAAKARRASKQSLVIVTDIDRVEKYGEYGRAIALPISYGRLRAICLEASHTIGQPQEYVGSTVSPMP